MGKTVNDTSFSTKEVLSHFDDAGIELHYGTFAIHVTKEAFAEAREIIADTPQSDLQSLLISVETTLGVAAPKINDAMTWKPKDRKKFLDNFVNDLKLRDAIKLRLAN